MKKIIAYFLIVMMLFASGGCAFDEKNENNQKFVGQYEKYKVPVFYGTTSRNGIGIVWNDAVSGTKTMTLNEDGTGKVTFTHVSYDKYDFTEEEITKLTEQMSSELTWEVVDGYLIVNYIDVLQVSSNGKTYYVYGEYSGDGGRVSDTYTYELKGNVLIDLERDDAPYKYKKMK